MKVQSVRSPQQTVPLHHPRPPCFFFPQWHSLIAFNSSQTDMFRLFNRPDLNSALSCRLLRFVLVCIRRLPDEQARSAKDGEMSSCCKVFLLLSIEKRPFARLRARRRDFTSRLAAASKKELENVRGKRGFWTSIVEGVAGKGQSYTITSFSW